MITRRLPIAAAAVAGLLLTACAGSYENTVSRGHRYDWESTRTPPEVARCVTERVQSHKPWQLTQRPLGDRGAIELVIGTGGKGITAVAHVSPSPYGSRIEGWLTSYAVLTRDALHEQFFGGC